MESRAARTVREIFESGRPLTYIRSSEEQRVARVLKEVVAAQRAMPVWTWSLTESMRGEGGAVEPDTESPRAALEFIIEAVMLVDVPVTTRTVWGTGAVDPPPALLVAPDAHPNCVAARHTSVNPRIASPPRDSCATRYTSGNGMDRYR